MASLRVEKVELEPRKDAYKILDGDETLSFQQVFDGMAVSAPLREALTAALVASRFEAFYWETPSFTRANLSRPFEFVLINAPRLATASVDRFAFVEHIGEPGDSDGVAVFRNLGGNAVLVAPCPTASFEQYTHLASFLRHAPTQQVDALWQAIGANGNKLASEKPCWLSTAGDGVSWLHVRFDERPKYYKHREYARG